jgi:ABC-type branched-subunit amino acid transport system ATPase component
VAELPFGRRRMVELARALGMAPRLLLLDEPASGLNSRESRDLASTIRRVRARGVSILLVEHDMSLVMAICDSLLVLNFGMPIAEGTPAAVRGDPKVLSVYLGEESAHAEG